MYSLIETIRSGLKTAGELTETLFNCISLLIIIWGVIISLKRSLTRTEIPGVDHSSHKYFRRMFGGWLVVALEFLLASDIVGTLTDPNTKQLIELGVVALIRTFLNYFLNKELKEELLVTYSEGEKKEKQ